MEDPNDRSQPNQKQLSSMIGKMFRLRGICLERTTNVPYKRNKIFIEITIAYIVKFMLNYNRIFVSALESVLEDYRKGRVRFLTEADLQSHLFSKCLELMKQEAFTMRFPIHAEKGVFERRKKIDLVLGDDEVLVEIKVEPDYLGVSKPVVFSTIKEAGGRGFGSVEEDLLKIKDYARKGKHAHFVMIDEDGRHARKIPGDWRQINVGGKICYCLHVYHKPEHS